MIHKPLETQNSTEMTAGKSMEDEKAHQRKRYLIRLRWLLCLLLVVGLFVYAFNTAYIPSSSMKPSLRPGDRILTMRAWLAYPMQKIPSRGDIILFESPAPSGPSGVKANPRPIDTGGGAVSKGRS